MNILGNSKLKSLSLPESEVHFVKIDTLLNFEARIQFKWDDCNSILESNSELKVLRIPADFNR
jgi:hypothetical protein